jgi:hypothetical protein
MNLQDRIEAELFVFKNSNTSRSECAKVILALVEGEMVYKVQTSNIKGRIEGLVDDIVHAEKPTVSNERSPQSISEPRATIQDSIPHTVSEQCCGKCKRPEKVTDAVDEIFIYDEDCDTCSCHSPSSEVEPTAPVGGWESEFDSEFPLPDHPRLTKCDCATDEEHEARTQWTAEQGNVRYFIYQTIKNREREIAEGVDAHRRMESDYDDDDKKARRDVRPFNEGLDLAIALINKQ